MGGVFILGSFRQTKNAETTQETTQEKIIDIIKTQPFITRRELAEKIGMSSNGIKYHLNNLKSAGIIQHIGSTKFGYWEILK